MTLEEIEKQAYKLYPYPQIIDMQAAGWSGFVKGAEWMQKKMYWKARKAFCSAVCPDGCPQLEDDIEGGGNLVVNCKKYHAFIKAMEEDA